MVDLTVYNTELTSLTNDDCASFYIQTYNKLNIVLGDSGTGKSHFFFALQEALQEHDPWSYRCIDSHGGSIEVIAINEQRLFDSFISDKYSNKVVVIDEGLTSKLRQEGQLGRLEKSNNYFILLDRQLKIKLDVNVNAAYIVKETMVEHQKVIKFIPFAPLQRCDIKEADLLKITHFITEDEASGKIFWTSLLGRLTVLDLKHTGSGGLKEAIIDALKNIPGDILIAMDYDRSARILQDILESNSVDTDRIHFIPLESFEEVICNSEFILSKYPKLARLVTHYKDYINACSKSTGKYFSMLLNNYVKQEPPILNKKKTDAKKFYSKGSKCFKQCFIDDCCVFAKDDCRLLFDGDKKNAMLANKFEQYRSFM